MTPPAPALLSIERDRRYRARLEQWSVSGFTVNRLEHEYLIPTEPEATGLRGAATLSGIDVVSAAKVDVAGLRRLDEELRTDVPGSDGWINDPQEFREYTFAPRNAASITFLTSLGARHTGGSVELLRRWRS